MVSPPFKGGFGALQVEGAASGGEAVVYYSPGAFAGAPGGPALADYLARRAPSGWSTVPLMPPIDTLAIVPDKDVTPSLDSVLASGWPGPNSNEYLPEMRIVSHSTAVPDTEEGWSLIGTLPLPGGKETGAVYEGATEGFCHVLIFSTRGLVVGAGGTKAKFYDLSRGCDGEEAAIRQVGLNNLAHPINNECAVDWGDQIYAGSGQSSRFNAIDAVGEEIFFSECAGAEEARSPHQLFVRLAGTRTVEVSRPVGVCVGAASPHRPGEVPCAGAAERSSANFAGASRDGSRAYFTTNAPLTAGDSDTSNDLYLANLGCPDSTPACEPSERELIAQTQVSYDPNGAPANVLGVVRVAPDGSRVYFVARGDLLTVAERESLQTRGRAVPIVGAANLYVYDANTATVAFIGDLCSSIRLSGAVEDGRCPGPGSDVELWAGNFGEAQTAGVDGRFLVFASSAQLNASDANAVSDVYRYNAATEALVRVSHGEGGFAANGNEASYGAQIAPGHHGGPLRWQYELDNRAVTEDGSRIVFTSTDALSLAVSNGLANVYEWREEPGGGEGSVSLVSTGTAEKPVTDIVVSSDGSSVFFVTTDGLAPQDTDGAPDVYDARLEGGFPAPSVEAQRCRGEECQGPLSNPAPLIVPGSVSQAPGHSYVPQQASRPHKKRRAKGHKHKRRSTRTRHASRGVAGRRRGGRHS